MTDDIAAKAVARHLRVLNIDIDPDVAALEILQILRGHGWRPTQTHLPPPAARPVPPDAVHAYAERVRAALARETPDA